MRKKNRRTWTAVLFSLIMILGSSTNALATEIRLPDGGSTTWYKYATVLGRTTKGSRGQADVICGLTVISGSYSTVYDVVSVNIANATVNQTPALAYYRGSEKALFTMTPATQTTLMGTNLKVSDVIDNQSDYKAYGSVSFYGAHQINTVTYLYYGTWTSRNYSGTNF